MNKSISMTYGGSQIKYTLTRSRRKTVGISISINGDINVAAPIRASELQVSEIVEKKIPWILKKLEEVRNRQNIARKERIFTDGEVFPYLGSDYILRIHIKKDQKRISVFLDNGYIDMILPEGMEEAEQEFLIRNSLRNWYIKKFEDIIRDRIPVYSKLIGRSPQRVTIREQKTRWGSCSAKGSINLNWKLVMAPPEVLDYVIIHELCHMRHMNHSSKYWDVVGGIMPEYEVIRRWLKTNGHKLVF